MNNNFCDNKKITDYENIYSFDKKVYTKCIKIDNIKDAQYYVLNKGYSAVWVFLQSSDDGVCFENISSGYWIQGCETSVIKNTCTSKYLRLVIIRYDCEFINCEVCFQGYPNKGIVVCNTVNVKGTVDIGNTVEVKADNLDIRRLNKEIDSIQVSGDIWLNTTTIVALNSFENYKVSLKDVKDKGSELTIDTSTYKMYSYYIKNNSLNLENKIKVKLQVSPILEENYFVDDISGEYIIEGGEKMVLVPQYYLKYTRMYFMVIGDGTVDVEIHFNGQL